MSKTYKFLLQISGAILIFLSLYSYNSLDPSFNSSSYGAVSVHNYIGIIGAYFSDILMQLFGLGSFVIPVLMIYMYFFKPRSYMKTVGTVFVISSSIFISLVNKQGGIAGNITSQYLIEYIGVVASFVLMSLVNISLLLYLFGISFRDLFLHIRIKYKFLVGFMLGTNIIGLFSKIFSFASIKTSFINLVHLPVVLFESPDVFFKTMLTFLLISPLVPVLIFVLIAKFTYNYFKKQKTQSKIKTTRERRGFKEVRPQRRLRKERVKTEHKILKQNTNLTINNTINKIKKYLMPNISLLAEIPRQRQKVSMARVKEIQNILQEKLNDFKVKGKITHFTVGPVITQYEFKPASGVKISKVAALSNDLALALGAGTVRVVAPIPGKSVVGIEVPNPVRELVYAKDMLKSSSFRYSDTKIPIVIGKTTDGDSYVFDLSKAPHLLVAGATGSGKSVFINTLITSILYRFKPEELKLVMVDPKMIELSVYADIPHLLFPVITDVKLATNALKWLVKEMESRYKKLSEFSVRNIDSYNKKANEKLPYIVVIIDELADLMMVSPKDVESSIARLAQMARAAGIHLVLATQRPSVNVITGLIKANFPARISFKVSSNIDSRTILDTKGAEKLLGMGDMLFLQPNIGKMLRLHGAFISDDDVKNIANFLKKQEKPKYIDVELDSFGTEESSDYEDDLYAEAVDLIYKTRRASISFIQQKFRIGYNRAARIIDAMEARGIVSSPDRSGRREVI